MLLTYDWISGAPWGSSVFLGVPGPTVLSSLQDSLILACSHHPILIFIIITVLITCHGKSIILTIPT